MTGDKEVRVTGVDIPFMDMVAFMIKWALASIPAAIILIVGGSILSAVFAGMLK